MIDNEIPFDREKFIKNHLPYTKIPRQYYNADIANIRKNIKSAEDLDKLKQFLDLNHQKIKNLFLYGPNGSGKTYVGAALVIKMVGNRLQSYYTTTYSMLREAKEQAVWGIPNKYYQPYVLFIDEFGKELDNRRFTIPMLENLIDYRINSGRMTIIASNADIKQVEKFYGPTITSRIVGHFVPVHFNETDLRYEENFFGRVKEKNEENVAEKTAAEINNPET